MKKYSSARSLLKPLAKYLRFLLKYDYIIALSLVSIYSLEQVVRSIFTYVNYSSLPWYFAIFSCDIMWISANICGLFLISFCLDIPRRFDIVFARLVNSKVIDLAASDTENLIRKIRAESNKSGQIIGIICGLTMLFYWFILKHTVDWSIVSAVTASYVAAKYPGKGLGYGMFVHVLRSNNIKLNLEPENLDEACGLRPLGYFYFYQAAIMMVPAIYFAIWWLVIPLIDWIDYGYWRLPFLGLLLITLIMEFMILLFPLFSLHGEMITQKQEWLIKADILNQRASQIYDELIQINNSQSSDELEMQLNQIKRRYTGIENMPTWPVDSKLFRQFLFSNITISIPLLSQIFGNQDFWEGLKIVALDLISQ